MAGLTVLLETHNRNCARESGRGPQILIKSSMQLRRYSMNSNNNTVADASVASAIQPSEPASLSPSFPTYSAFLESCYLCRKLLSHEKDIYIYRGDRAFCSVECRNNHMMNDEKTSSPQRRGRRRAVEAGATGGFAY